MKKPHEVDALELIKDFPDECLAWVIIFLSVNSRGETPESLEMKGEYLAEYEENKEFADKNFIFFCTTIITRMMTIFDRERHREGDG